MDFKEIESLIDNKQYLEAEQQISIIIKDSNNSEKDISIANYLLGYIYTCWNFDKKSTLKAKRYLLDCIKSTYPIPSAIDLFAKIEEDKNVAINYLRDGLKKFPANPEIYVGLLRESIKSEQLEIINEIKLNGSNDYNLLITHLPTTYNTFQ
ncbi:MAG TPA: hypothetical protein VIK72_15950 [Clostridiaceae bacterium]